MACQKVTETFKFLGTFSWWEKLTSCLYRKILTYQYLSKCENKNANEQYVDKLTTSEVCVFVIKYLVNDKSNLNIGIYFK